MALTKFSLTEKISNDLGITMKEATKTLGNILDIMKDELVDGRNVKISGFGMWKVNNKRSRLGNNPQTGEPMTINARRVVTFKCSGILKKACFPFNNDKHIY